MKRTAYLLLLSFFFMVQQASGQLWKQYTDSARYYAAKQDLEKATDYYDNAKKILERDSLWTMDHLLFCMNYGIFFKRHGYMTEAEPYYIEARKIAEKIGGKNVFYTKTCNNMGLLYTDMGYYSKAEQLFYEAREINLRLEGKNQSYGLSCNNLGMLYYTKGDYEKAEMFYTEAIEVYKKVSSKDSDHYLSAANNLANLFKLIGQFEKAEPLLAEAVSATERLRGKAQTQYANFAGNLGSLYLSMKRYQEAGHFLQEARAAWEKMLGKQHALYASSTNNLGSLYRYTGETAKAEQYYLEALKVMEQDMEIGDIYAVICSNLGELYSASDKAKAEFYLKKSDQIREKYGIVDNASIDNCDHLGDFYAGTDQADSAIRYYLKGYSTQVSTRRSVFEFTSESEKRIYLRTLTGFYDKLLSACTGSKKIPDAFDIYDHALANRHLLLLSTKQVREDIHAMRDSSVLKKYMEWVETKEELSFWLSKPVFDREKKDSILEEKANLLEKELTRISATFKTRQREQGITWKDIHKNLKNGEAAIEFVEFQYFDGNRTTDSAYYIALLLRKDNPRPVLIRLFEKKQLEALLKYRNISPGRQQVNFIYSGKLQVNRQNTLYNLIWKPLESSLSGIHTVYFAPAALLHKISFAALPVEATQVLSDKYQLVQLNTTGSVTDTTKKGISANERIVLYGGIQYDADSASISLAAARYGTNNIAGRSFPEDLARNSVQEFLFLSGTESETVTIRKMADTHFFPVTVIQGLQATEESFKFLKGIRSPAVLHIATHGFFFPDPVRNKKDERAAGATVFQQSNDPLIRSGLVLAGANNTWKGKPVTGVQDGILTAYEVSNMHLPNTRLAVLSACETGLGDIQGSEGVYGLQRAFKIAGVKNLVMSLWKVPDAETAEFMQEFYQQLFANQTISDAFYDAQTIMKNKYRNEPYKWAAWVMIR